jgi:hypothetical protein
LLDDGGLADYGRPKPEFKRFGKTETCASRHDKLYDLVSDFVVC